MDSDIQFLGMRFTSEMPQPPSRDQPRDVIEIVDSDDEFAGSLAGPSQLRKRVDEPAVPPRSPCRPYSDGPSGFRQTRNDLAEGSFNATASSVPSSRSASAMPDRGEPLWQRYVAQILEIVPDVLPSHVLELVERYIDAHDQNVTERVLEVLFESTNYPKASNKGKGKRKRADDDEGDVGLSRSKRKVDYASKNRERPRGQWYIELSLVRLLLRSIHSRR